MTRTLWCRWTKYGKIAHRDDQSVISIFLYDKHNQSSPYLQDKLVNRVLTSLSHHREPGAGGRIPKPSPAERLPFC